DILIPTLVGINLLGLIASIVLSIFFTHRIAGPVYRLCRILKEIGQGNLVQSIHFRKSDELKELDAAATEMITSLQARVRTLQNLSADLICQTEILSVNGSQPECRAMRETARQLEGQLAEFRLPSTAS
ncbi:MAG: hypothetical protein AB1649_17630, partial [Chloroflexota bacterium]